MTGLLLGIVAVQTARMLPQAFFGLYAEKALAVSPWVTGSCYGATALGLCVSATAWSRRFARGVRRDILAEAALCAGACALLTLGQLPGVPLPALLAARFLWGVCLGALLPVFYALLSREAPDSRQGMAMGWGNAAAKAGALAGTVLGGTMLGVLPLQWLMMPVAVAYALTALSLWRLRRMGTPSSRDLGLAARSEG